MQAHQAPEHYALDCRKEPRTMQHSHAAPPCPRCGTPVYRTHTCRVSGLRPPVDEPVVAMPSTFRHDLEAARRQARVEALAFELNLDLDVAGARVRAADRAWSEDAGL